jgi:hypothetical protein
VSSRSIGQSLSLNALQHSIGASNIINAKLDAVIITEVEFSDIAVQMLFVAVLINAFHATFEDAVVALNRIGMNGTAHIFLGFVADALMAREMIAKREIAASFIGHHRGFFRDVGLNDRNKLGRTHAIDMERAHLPAFAVNERKNRILMAVAATLDRAFLAADEGFVGFNNTASAAHGSERAIAHSLTNSMRQEPCALPHEFYATGTMRF